MTIRQKNTNPQLGQIFQNKRNELSLKPNSRQHFLDDRVQLNLLTPEDISLKSLTNIENGKNVPTLKTIKILASALEIDAITLIKEILLVI